MNDLLDDDDPRHSRNERELTLSTGAILGIFFGLVLVCGACFGLGYNMGRKSTPTPLALNDTNVPTDSLADAGSGAKPSAGSPADNAASSPPAIVATPPATPKPAPVVRRPPPPEPADETSIPAAAAPVTRATPPAATPAARTVPPGALMPGAGAAPGAGSIIVQVAAVSHQEDADLLVGALRSRGYTVSARPSASDGFIHVQVGPFSNKKDAEAMRQRLIADGYNAILK
jgi:cell division septation protein DedD